MNKFDLIFNCMYIGIFIYQVLYFLVQYVVLKRIELLYYSLFLLGTSLFFYAYVLTDILHNRFNTTGLPRFSSLQLSFQFIFVFLYLLFLNHFLELYKKKARIYYVVKYYKYYNLFFFFVFILLDALKIDGQLLALFVSLFSLPVSFSVIVMLWRINTKYAKVVLYGTLSTHIGNIVYFVLIIKQVNPYQLYGNNIYLPLQAGLLLDVFILGYGLSLKAAESDKKLVQTLLENQKIVEAERNRIAKDLHDGLGSLLSGLKLTLRNVNGNAVLSADNTKVFTRALGQLDNTIAEMRRVAHSMMPEALLRFGLSEAIQDYCDGLNETQAVKIKFVEIGKKQHLEKSAEVTLYRIVQELTNNAIKHAAAKMIFIQLGKHDEGLTITVEDDGKGFDTRPLKKGAGLQNVQSRLDYLKGFFNIESEPGKGTSVTVEMPVEQIQFTKMNVHEKF